MTGAGGARNFDPPGAAPDPTSLTTASILREIGSLRELLEARLDAMDRATMLFESNLSRVPTETDEAVGHLAAVQNEKFRGVDTRFEDVQRQFEQQDKRTEQTSREAKEAVATAFTASKEAVAAALSAQKELGAAQNTANAVAAEKSDKQTRDLLEQLRILQNTTAESLAGQLRTNAANTDGKISDLKDSVTALATVVTSIQGRSTGQGQSWSFIVAALGAALGVGGFVLALTR